MSNPSFASAVWDAWGKPDSWDKGGAIFATAEEAFKEFGELAAKAQRGALIAADAARLQYVANYFAASVGEVIIKINASGAVALTPDEIRLRAFMYNQLGSAQRLAEATRLLAIDVANNTPNSQQVLSASGAQLLKIGGGLLAITQVGFAYGFDGAEEGAKKLLGALGGFAGAPVGALAGAGAVKLGALAANTVASGLAVSVGAVLGAAAGGFLVGKAFEESYGYIFRPLLDEMFERGGAAWRAADTFFANSLQAIGKLDGNWMESFSGLADADKASLTTLFAGSAKVAFTESMFADIKKLFVADFTGQALVGRDLLLQTILTFAKENGYTTERITANAANVTLDLPDFPNSSVGALRDFAQKQLSEADQRGFSLIGPSRIVIAIGAGTHSASSKTSINIDGKLIKLSLGMNLTAEIKTGQRRVIEYLLSPIQKAGNESLRER